MMSLPGPGPDQAQSATGLAGLGWAFFYVLAFSPLLPLLHGVVLVDGRDAYAEAQKTGWLQLDLNRT